jgi:hypothetical protein
MAALLRPVCTDCGSDNVMRDAWAIWNMEDQEWDLSQTFDEAFCQNCEGSCKLEFKEEA